MFYADLHLHSKYSRATSRDADLEHMALWARKKGIALVATGDFTHPQWFQEIQEKLVPAEPGLFRLRDDLQRLVDQDTPPSCRNPVRFLLQVEISTIYKKNDRTRKIHHVIYVPGFEEAQRLIDRLSRIGNLASDGRPILGLDSRDLLEITLECGDGCYLVPAHVWTPWFALFGSQSGFDDLEECYGDLSGHIFALETGLSSDPPMNWRWSRLDGYALVSNSDAHSPAKIAREACAFDTELDYFAIRRALETREGYQGTVEFFPEEGKYHLDGHRKCGVRLEPAETRRLSGLCPECGKRLTVGVMHRVESLADRPEGAKPPTADPFRSFIPLPEVLSEIRQVGEKSKTVQRDYEAVLAKVGPELCVLDEASEEQLRRAGFPVLAEAVIRMRAGRVIREAGFDGQYGTIRVFEPEEIDRSYGARSLFGPAAEPVSSSTSSGKKKTRTLVAESRADGREPTASLFPEPTDRSQSASAEAQPDDQVRRRPKSVAPAGPAEMPALEQPLGESFLEGLDPEQREAAMHVSGPLVVVAGPGTGKTRTLTRRLAYVIAEGHAAPEQCLTLTFSRRAVAELQERLRRLLPKAGRKVPVMTFHTLGLLILREHGQKLGLPESFRVAADEERRQLLVDGLQISDRRAAKLLSQISKVKRSNGPTAVSSRSKDGLASAPNVPTVDSTLQEALRLYQVRLRQHALVDFDDLILLPCELLERHSELADHYRRRWPWVSVDEFQDTDAAQYRLVRLLAPTTGNICVIGDPDQSIYGFRGADPQVFQRFQQDYPGAKVVHLTTNYRSTPAITDGALQAIRPASLVPDRKLRSLLESPERIQIHACRSERAEAEFVVHTIERLIGGHAFFSMDSGRVGHEQTEPLSFDDFAVLYRTEAQAPPLVEALQRSGIPFQKRTHLSLADDPDVRRMLRVMHELLLGQESPRPGTAVELLKWAADTVWSQAESSSERLLADLHELAERFGEDCHGFLNELALGMQSDLWDPRANRVSLLTLHAAKGLEFRVVFLVGCEDGLLPLRWGRSAGQATEDGTEPTQGDPNRQEAEERRLFFVGMTRARDRLFLCHAKKRLWQGKVRPRRPSPFLNEIAETLLQRTTQTARRKSRRADTAQRRLFD
ncbi:MAG: UvrD-helicase domain-containing protein [Planctomycetes bacterium]|nr:UvrD-helicase domain-containing protein [Planctomycetota bacterium]